MQQVVYPRLVLLSKNVTHTNICSYGTLPSQSRVVIVGAGVVANSVAYHLVQKGWNDITIIEQRKIGSGTSHFGSGTLGLFKPISHRNLIWQDFSILLTQYFILLSIFYT